MLRNTNFEVTVKKSDLISHLRKNREVHVKEYDEASIVYFKRLRIKLRDMLQSAEGDHNRKDNYNINLETPRNKEKEYDKYINMLELCVDEDMKISTDDFDHIVNDNWDWVVGAKMLNSSYLT